MDHRSPLLLASLLACGPAAGDDTRGDDPTSPTLPTNASQEGTSSPSSTSTGTASGSNDDRPVEDDSTTSSDDGFVFDLGTQPDAPPQDGCLECSISLFTTASTSLAPMGDGLLVEVLLDGQLVYALDEWGPGRLVFSGDSNILFAEGECPIWSWLGGTGAAVDLECFPTPAG